MSRTETFNRSDADVIIESSDNVLFHLNRKCLEVNTGSFPGEEIKTDGEHVHLTELANVLELMFKFVYPSRYPPNLDCVDFSLLLQLAEAIEKYQVFPAMYPYECAFRKHLKEHHVEVLVYALKHNLYDLTNEAAGHMLFAGDDIDDRVPIEYLRPWTKYRRTTWDAIFGRAKRKLMSLKVDGTYLCQPAANPPSIYAGCHTCIVRWLWHLEQVGSITQLSEALNSFSDYSTNGLSCNCTGANNGLGPNYIPQVVGIESNNGRSVWAPVIAGICSDGIRNMKQFTHFVGIGQPETVQNTTD